MGTPVANPNAPQIQTNNGSVKYGSPEYWAMQQQQQQQAQQGVAAAAQQQQSDPAYQAAVAARNANQQQSTQDLATKLGLGQLGANQGLSVVAGAGGPQGQVTNNTAPLTGPPPGGVGQPPAPPPTGGMPTPVQTNYGGQHGGRMNTPNPPSPGQFYQPLDTPQQNFAQPLVAKAADVGNPLTMLQAGAQQQQPRGAQQPLANTAFQTPPGQPTSSQKGGPQDGGFSGKGSASGSPVGTQPNFDTGNYSNSSPTMSMNGAGGSKGGKGAGAVNSPTQNPNYAAIYGG